MRSPSLRALSPRPTVGTVSAPATSVCLLLALAACEGPQSALDAAGFAAREIASLWWLLASGAVVIFLVVIGCAVYATRVAPRAHPDFAGTWFILGGGVVLPVVVLTLLLTHSFLLGRDLSRPLPPGALRIEVVGKQWWWEVRYLVPNRSEPVVSANELRLPVGEPVELALTASDVIHSFWLPSIAGKRDMIPGQVNRLVLEAEEEGVYRGQCAEYCGGAHALMAFYAVAAPPDEFAAWLEREAGPAVEPDDAFLQKGRELFLESGCGTCHTIRGTEAQGTFGPDLTHLGSRRSLAAGILPNNIGAIAGWIVDSQHIKPANKMPSFNVFSGEELRALAAYLASLE
jgi:cytochrome c oxidase subunit 2